MLETIKEEVGFVQYVHHQDDEVETYIIARDDKTLRVLATNCFDEEKRYII